MSVDTCTNGADIFGASNHILINMLWTEKPSTYFATLLGDYVVLKALEDRLR
jgi:hypothetical protein